MGECGAAGGRAPPGPRRHDADRDHLRRLRPGHAGLAGRARRHRLRRIRVTVSQLVRLGPEGRRRPPAAPAADDAAAVVDGRPRDARPRLPRAAAGPAAHHRRLRRPVRHQLRRVRQQPRRVGAGPQLVRAAVDAAHRHWRCAGHNGRPRRRGRPADGRGRAPRGRRRDTADARAVGRPGRAPRRLERRSRLAPSHPSSRTAEEEGEEGPVRQEEEGEGAEAAERLHRRLRRRTVHWIRTRCARPLTPTNPCSLPSLFTPETKPLNHQQAIPRARPPRPPIPLLSPVRPPHPSQGLLPAATRRRHRCRRRAAARRCGRSTRPTTARSTTSIR